MNNIPVLWLRKRTHTSTSTYKDTEYSCPPNFTKRTSREKKIATKSLVPFPFQLRRRKETLPPRSEGAPSPESFSEPQLPSNTKAGTRPKLHRSRIGSRHRLTPRGSRGRSARHPTAAHTAISAPMTKRVTSTAAPPHRRNNGRRRLLHRSQRSRTPPPRARWRHRSGAPLRRGRTREDLIPSLRRRHRLAAAAGHRNLDILGPKLHRVAEKHRFPSHPTSELE